MIKTQKTWRRGGGEEACAHRERALSCSEPQGRAGEPRGGRREGGGPGEQASPLPQELGLGNVSFPGSPASLASVCCVLPAGRGWAGVEARPEARGQGSAWLDRDQWGGGGAATPSAMSGSGTAPCPSFVVFLLSHDHRLHSVYSSCVRVSSTRR